MMMVPDDPSTKHLKNVKILVVDDEEILAWSIDTELAARGGELMRAGSVREAIERFEAFHPDLAIVDLHLPDGNGLELLKKWGKSHPDTPIILITAHGAVDSAITAVRHGALDYLQKPFDMKNLVSSVTRAAEISKLRQKVSRLQGREIRKERLQIVGESKEMQRLRGLLEKIAKSKANTTLILGDSGTGKELAARAIHEWSKKAHQPFVEINCASIPETLLESELFGYEKGAFTDARDRKLGLFEMARNGTIFLDEIGEMPLKLQTKLLRALEYRRFKRLGGTKDIEFSGRIVAATNRNLLQEVAEKRFRADLFYRLNVLRVNIPLLRERPDDIPVLVNFFLEKLATELEVRCPRVSASVMDILQSYEWPGNIRELKNTLERSLVFYEPEELLPEHIELDKLPTDRLDPSAQPTIDANGSAQKPHGSHALVIPDEGLKLEDLEKNLLVQALDRAKNNQTKAAHLLGISRHTLRYRLEKHGLLESHH